jgi:hypothetical protein
MLPPPINHQANVVPHGSLLTPGLKPMSSDDTKKPMPSAEEISAYLEASAARTKKRLPLAFDKPAPAEKKKARALPTTKGGPPRAQNTPSAAGVEPSGANTPEPAEWQPPPGDDRE